MFSISSTNFDDFLYKLNIQFSSHTHYKSLFSFEIKTIEFESILIKEFAHKYKGTRVYDPQPRVGNNPRAQRLSSKRATRMEGGLLPVPDQNSLKPCLNDLTSCIRSEATLTRLCWRRVRISPYY